MSWRGLLKPQGKVRSESQLWGCREGGKSEGRSRRERAQRATEHALSPPFPTLRQPIPHNPGLLGLSPRPTPLGADLVPSLRPLALPAHSGGSGRLGEGGPAPSSAGRSRGDRRAVSAVSLRDAGRRGRGERDTDLETVRDRKEEPEGAAAERTRVPRGARRTKSREGAPTGQAVPSRPGGRGSRVGARPARAHLVTVRRARGLCALSRPRRAPMPARTSSAATPHTA